MEFRRAGFLSYAHDGPPADMLVTKYALHHLPDFWKSVALLRMNEMLRPAGRLFLSDVVFSFPMTEHRHEIDTWIARMAKPSGEDSRPPTSLLMFAMSTAPMIGSSRG
jgi:hypothetical protein